MGIWIRRTLIAVVSLLVLAVLAVAALVWMGDRKRERTVELPALRSPAFVDDAAARERGAYLYGSRGCGECHGADGAGRLFVDDGKGMKVKGPAIHSGPSSVTVGYTPQDWDRIVRHGVKRNGRPAIVMPSEDYNRLTDADFAAVVAYVRALPPAGGGAAVVELPLPVRALYGAGYVQDAAAKIDHSLPVQQVVPEGVSLEHGRYVANTCLGCHGPQLAGGPVPGGPPDWPPAARLNKGPDSAMARYPNADAMIAMFRSGKRADGSVVKVMPFESFSKMSDTDLRALHLYLKSL
jgi:mono/diheme cytochrome c family protein